MENQTHTTDGTAKSENDAVVNEGVGYAGISVPEPPKIVRSERAIEVPGFDEAEETPKPSYEELEAKLAAANEEKAELEDKVATLEKEKAALEKQVQSCKWDIEWRRTVIDIINKHTVDQNLQNPFQD